MVATDSSSSSSGGPSTILASADLLARSVPETTRKLARLVTVEEKREQLESHSVFYREALPPSGNYSKATVLFLHGQAFTSETWLEHETLATFAAAGYRCLAIDLPGSGRTGGASVPNGDKVKIITSFLEMLKLKRVIVVVASMAAQYILPLIDKDCLTCVVGIAPSNTHELNKDLLSAIRLPFLVLWGERDTSLGPTAADNLKHLANARLMKVPQSGHACYLNNPHFFQTVCLNFFELVRNYHSVA